MSGEFSAHVHVSFSNICVAQGSYSLFPSLFTIHYSLKINLQNPFSLESWKFENFLLSKMNWSLISVK
jgi:hypothetical protein